MASNRSYSISEVVELTGATEFLLRAWENRYNVVTPKRTKTDRRLYSSEDVMKISKIVQLLQAGHKIGQLANLRLADLGRLESEKSDENKEKENENKILNKVFQYLSRTEWDKLKDLFESQRKTKKPLEFVMQFLIPLCAEMSQKSLKNGIDIIQEHILSSLIKENLYSVLNENKKSAKQKKILFASVEGDHHDLGLLIARTLAALKGYSCIYLGPHMPQKELAEACLRLKPDCVMIGTSLPSTARQDLLKYIHFFDQHVPKTTTLWVGGPAVSSVTLKLNRSFQIFKTLEEFDERLRVL